MKKARPEDLRRALGWLLEWTAEDMKQSLLRSKEMERGGETERGSAAHMERRMAYLRRIAAAGDAGECLDAADSLLMAANESICRKGSHRRTRALRCITEAQFQISDAITHAENS